VENGGKTGLIPVTPFPALVIVARLKLVVPETTADEVGPRPVLCVDTAPLLPYSATVDFFVATSSATPMRTPITTNTVTNAIAPPLILPYHGVDFDLVTSFEWRLVAGVGGEYWPLGPIWGRDEGS